MHDKIFDKFSLAKAIIKVPSILHFIEQVKGPKINLREIAQDIAATDFGMSPAVDLFYGQCGLILPIKLFSNPSSTSYSLYMIEKHLGFEGTMLISKPYSVFRSINLIKPILNED